MQVTLDLPDLPYHDYTGEFRPPKAGETCLLHGQPIVGHDNYNTGNASYPILRSKEKPKIVIYQWLIKSSCTDPSDRGYRIINGTEDRIIALCSKFNYTYKKISETPMFSLDGDFL